MPVPTKTKTWEYLVNQTAFDTSSSDNHHRDILFKIKQSMISGTLTTPWTVVSSSNSISTGAADHWTTAANLIWNNAASIHSWIVLKQTGIAANFQICIDCNTSNAFRMITIAYSHSSGFSGGTLSARPTAADELVHISQAQWGVHSNTANLYPVALHYMQASDGTASRVIMMYNGLGTAHWFIEEPGSAVSGWTDNAMLGVFAAATAGAAAANRATWSTLAKMTAKGASGQMSLFMEMNVDTAVAVPNAFDQSHPFAPIGVFSTTAANVGQHGVFADLWFTSPGAIPAGTFFPDDGSNEYVSVGDFIYPWNGSYFLRGA